MGCCLLIGFGGNRLCNSFKIVSAPIMHRNNNMDLPGLRDMSGGSGDMSSGRVITFSAVIPKVDSIVPCNTMEYSRLTVPLG